MVFTSSNSRRELSNQSSALFKRLVESGCMLCKTSALSGSGLGETGVNVCSFLGEAQATSPLSIKSGNSFFMFGLGLTELVGDPSGLLPVTKLLLLDLSTQLVQGLGFLSLVLVPQRIDVPLTLSHTRAERSTGRQKETRQNGEDDNHPRRYLVVYRSQRHFGLP